MITSRNAITIPYWSLTYHIPPQTIYSYILREQSYSIRQCITAAERLERYHVDLPCRLAVGLLSSLIFNGFLAVSLLPLPCRLAVGLLSSLIFNGFLAVSLLPLPCRLAVGLLLKAIDHAVNITCTQNLLCHTRLTAKQSVVCLIRRYSCHCQLGFNVHIQSNLL